MPNCYLQACASLIGSYGSTAIIFSVWEKNVRIVGDFFWPLHGNIVFDQPNCFEPQEACRQLGFIVKLPSLFHSAIDIDRPVHRDTQWLRSETVLEAFSSLRIAIHNQFS